MADDELDLDGDGVPDVRVPGLPGRIAADRTSEGGEPISSVGAQVDAVMPPTTSHLSPMGHIEHFGHALQSETARRGWRGRVIRSSVLVFMALMAGLLIVGAVSALTR